MASGGHEGKKGPAAAGRTTRAGLVQRSAQMITAVRNDHPEYASPRYVSETVRYTGPTRRVSDTPASAKRHFDLPMTGSPRIV